MEAVQGIARATRHSLTLPSASDTLPALTLDLLVARAIDDDDDDERRAPTVLYVLDPEPVLFGAACLHVYAGSGYFAAAPEASAERGFRRLHVVGIGHAREAFAATASGWDAPALRALRRRDLPPLEHHSIAPGRGRNAAAARLVDGILTQVFDHAERTLLGLGCRGTQRPMRCLLGASYTASLALQVLLRAPSAVDAFILGSPSVPFDPEILQWLEEAELTSSSAPPTPPANW